MYPGKIGRIILKSKGLFLIRIGKVKKAQ